MGSNVLPGLLLGGNSIPPRSDAEPASSDRKDPVSSSHAAYRREIEADDDPVAFYEELEPKLIATRSPFRTAEAFNSEDIIDPRDTQPVLHEWFQLAHDMPPPAAGRRARGTGP